MKDNDPLDAACLAAIERAIGGSPKGDETVAIVRVMRDAQINAAQLSRAVWSGVRPNADGSALLDAGKKSGERYLSIATMRVLAPLRGVGDEPLFAKPDGGALSAASVIKRIRAAAEAAGLRGFYGGASPALGMERDCGVSSDSLRHRKPRSIVRAWYALGARPRDWRLTRPQFADGAPAWGAPIYALWGTDAEDRRTPGLESAARGARLRAMLTAPPPQPGAERPTGTEWLVVGSPTDPIVPLKARRAIEPMLRLARELGEPPSRVGAAMERARTGIFCLDRPSRQWPPRPWQAYVPGGP